MTWLVWTMIMDFRLYLLLLACQSNELWFENLFQVRRLSSNCAWASRVNERAGEWFIHSSELRRLNMSSLKSRRNRRCSWSDRWSCSFELVVIDPFILLLFCFLHLLLSLLIIAHPRGLFCLGCFPKIVVYGFLNVFIHERLAWNVYFLFLRWLESLKLLRLLEDVHLLFVGWSLPRNVSWIWLLR